MSWLDWFNLGEAVLWISIGIMFLCRRIEGLTSPLRLILVTAFVLFGISDLIEIQTDAFWRPPSLLLLKGVCVIAIVTGLTRLMQQRPASEQKSAKPPG